MRPGPQTNQKATGRSQTNTSRSLAIEHLESRELLAVTATLVGGILTVNGDSAGNSILVEQRGGAIGVTGDSVDVGTFNGVQSIVVNGFEGEDVLRVQLAVKISAQLNGGLGRDLLIGGGGDDTLAGGQNDDTYTWLDPSQGNPGKDTIIELPNEGFDSIDLGAVSHQAGFYLTPNFQVPKEGGATFEVDNMEQLVGGSGNDTLIFANGARLANGAGVFNGSGGTNTLDYSRYSSAVDVVLTNATATGLAQVGNIQQVNAPLFQSNVIVYGVPPSQSPINFDHQVLSFLPAVNFDYDPEIGTEYIVSNGYDYEVEYANGSSIEWNGETYFLQQFHWHTPSEHYINGQQFPMEIHFVHKSLDGDVLVISVLVQLGTHLNGIDNLTAAQPTSAMPLTIDFDANVLLPATRNYETYEGSLTTSPFTEGVRWISYDTPIQMDAAQLMVLSQLAPNNRALQDRNGRIVRDDI